MMAREFVPWPRRNGSKLRPKPTPALTRNEFFPLLAMMDIFKKLLLSSVLLLSGCAHVAVKNTTPSIVPKNASGVYTISMISQLRDGDMDAVHPTVVIDGRPRTMQAISHNRFAYDFSMPRGRTAVDYYFDVSYSVPRKSGIRQCRARSATYQLQLANRFVLGLGSHRATPGATVGLMGQGLDPQDRVFVGGLEAKTTFRSPSELTFVVPTLPAQQCHQVILIGGEERFEVGELYIDAGQIRVAPTALEIPLNGRAHASLTFSAAANEDLEIGVTTDRPEGISMADLVLKQGRRIVSFAVDGLEIGSGTLYISAPGFRPITLPFRVTR